MNQTAEINHARHQLGRHSSSGEVVLAYLGAQATALQSLIQPTRRNEPDSVHRMRVAARRLRSTLQSFPMLLPKQATRSLRDDLKWIGEVLGDLRDEEVLSARFERELASAPAELVMGPARARVRAHFAPREAAAHGAALTALESPRFSDFLNDLRRLLEDPPFSNLAVAPAREVLPAAVGRAYRRARRRMRHAKTLHPGAARDAALHETRKAAKRTRYAAEAATPACGKDARRFGRRMKSVQSALGDHHDAVRASAAAREIGVRASLAGENAFSFGMLLERADHDAADSRAKAGKAWKRATRPKSLKWLGNITG